MATFTGADRDGFALDSGPFLPPAGADREWIVTSVVDSVPPVVSNESPPLSSVISRNTTVEFDVTDDVLIRRAVVLVRYPSGVYEVVHDGDSFSDAFAALSTRVVIPGGFHFALQRTGYWLERPTIRVIVTDAGGNEAV